MATARLDLRLDEEIKHKAEKASALLGMKSLTEYVVKIMDENATEVITQSKSMVIDDDIFDRFMDACNTLQEPNQALKDAAAFTREQGIK